MRREQSPPELGHNRSEASRSRRTGVGREPAGRGDGSKDSHATVETFAIELSQRIGAAPVGIVESGGGWHLHWAVAGGEIGQDFPVTVAKELLLCWRALARPAHPARWLPAPPPDRQPAALSVRCAPVLAGSDSTTALARQQRKTVAR